MKTYIIIVTLWCLYSSYTCWSSYKESENFESFIHISPSYFVISMIIFMSTLLAIFIGLIIKILFIGLKYLP